MTLAHAPEGADSKDEPSPDSGNLRVSLKLLMRAVFHRPAIGLLAAPTLTLRSISRAGAGREHAR
jgi:hypothetical protein